MVSETAENSTSSFGSFINGIRKRTDSFQFRKNSSSNLSLQSPSEPAQNRNLPGTERKAPRSAKSFHHRDSVAAPSRNAPRSLSAKNDKKFGNAGNERVASPQHMQANLVGGAGQDSFTGLDDRALREIARHVVDLQKEEVQVQLKGAALENLATALANRVVEMLQRDGEDAFVATATGRHATNAATPPPPHAPQSDRVRWWVDQQARAIVSSSDVTAEITGRPRPTSAPAHMSDLPLGLVKSLRRTDPYDPDSAASSALPSDSDVPLVSPLQILHRAAGAGAGAPARSPAASPAASAPPPRSDGRFHVRGASDVAVAVQSRDVDLSASFASLPMGRPFRTPSRDHLAPTSRASPLPPSHSRGPSADTTQPSFEASPSAAGPNDPRRLPRGNSKSNPAKPAGSFSRATGLHISLTHSANHDQHLQAQGPSLGLHVLTPANSAPNSPSGPDPYVTQPTVITRTSSNVSKAGSGGAVGTLGGPHTVGGVPGHGQVGNGNGAAAVTGIARTGSGVARQGSGHAGAALAALHTASNAGHGQSGNGASTSTGIARTGSGVSKQGSGHAGAALAALHTASNPGHGQSGNGASTSTGIARTGSGVARQGSGQPPGNVGKKRENMGGVMDGQYGGSGTRGVPKSASSSSRGGYGGRGTPELNVDADELPVESDAGFVVSEDSRNMVLKSGFLWHKTQEFLVKRWKRQYLVLVGRPRPHSLFAHKDQTDSVDGSNGKKYSLVGGCLVLADTESNGRWPFTVASGAHKLCLAADTQQERDEWIRLIKSAS